MIGPKIYKKTMFSLRKKIWGKGEVERISFQHSTTESDGKTGITQHALEIQTRKKPSLDFQVR
jgi:hypothetical protein